MGARDARATEKHDIFAFTYHIGESAYFFVCHIILLSTTLKNTESHNFRRQQIKAVKLKRDI